MKRLTRLFRPTAAPPDFGDAPLSPEAPFVAVGDIHGCDDLLAGLLDRLAAHDRQAPLVFVGDYVDRGAYSAQVLARLQDMQQSRPAQVTCLRGNHEEMLLLFLGDPEKYGAYWLRYGGAATLSSFGLGWVNERATPEALRDAAHDLRAALGEGALGWLQSLPRAWHSGNVSVVHAGADPALPMDQQTDRALTWGHPDFLRLPRQDGRWVVHGHTITDEPGADQGRVAIDTGAYATGRLTAVHVTPGGATFL
ncbi:metallophosphoesterase family protein [Actibacterium sp. XHP0104]|uniref:metallophosphoesterase family protein n=1 Tax=Actibacterium sp. XHP0104 TaxID=2984335 RepID=UPI0021E8D2F0|nr:metallophosphoesterase family protein [Actibacterium sp. XHP0104]MCV2882222.1 serine/threonine protein phosphatase [Actibacterium sp. XHP0104]